MRLAGLPNILLTSAFTWLAHADHVALAGCARSLQRVARLATSSRDALAFRCAPPDDAASAPLPTHILAYRCRSLSIRCNLAQAHLDQIATMSSLQTYRQLTTGDDYQYLRRPKYDLGVLGALPHLHTLEFGPLNATVARLTMLTALKCDEMPLELARALPPSLERLHVHSCTGESVEPCSRDYVAQWWAAMGLLRLHSLTVDEKTGHPTMPFEQAIAEAPGALAEAPDALPTALQRLTTLRCGIIGCVLPPLPNLGTLSCAASGHHRPPFVLSRLAGIQSLQLRFEDRSLQLGAGPGWARLRHLCVRRARFDAHKSRSALAPLRPTLQHLQLHCCKFDSLALLEGLSSLRQLGITMCTPLVSTTQTTECVNVGTGAVVRESTIPEILDVTLPSLPSLVRLTVSPLLNLSDPASSGTVHVWRQVRILLAPGAVGVAVSESRGIKGLYETRI